MNAERTWRLVNDPEIYSRGNRTVGTEIHLTMVHTWSARGQIWSAVLTVGTAIVAACGQQQAPPPEAGGDLSSTQATTTGTTGRQKRRVESTQVDEVRTAPASAPHGRGQSAVDVDAKRSATPNTKVWRAAPAYTELADLASGFVDEESCVIADVDGASPPEILVTDRQSIDVFRVRSGSLQKVKRLSACTESQFEGASLLGTGRVEGSDHTHLFLLVREGSGLGYRIARLDMATGNCASIVSYDANRLLNAGAEIVSYGFGDFTGDGLPDLAALSDNTVHCWQAARQGQYTKTVLHRRAGAAWTGPSAHYRLADFNGDGSVDLFRYALGISELLFCDKAGSFGEKTAFGDSRDGVAIEGMESVFCAMPADLDGSGGTDLLADSVGIVEISRRGGKRFALPTEELRARELPSFDGQVTRACVAPDLNRDRIPDTILFDGQNLRVRTSTAGRSPGANPFFTEAVVDCGTFALSYSVGDVSGDDWPDIVVWGTSPPAVCALISQP